MNLFPKIYPIFLLNLMIIMFSCSSSKEAGNVRKKKTENKKTAFIVNQVKANEFYPESISFKASTTVTSGSKSNSFRASYRIVKDSIIWISITKVGYEAARVFATPDTLMVVNRLDKKYFVGNYDYIEDKFNINLGFSDLQAILLGNSIGLDEPKKLKRTQNKEYYTLRSLSKRRIKRATEKGRAPDDDAVYVHKIDPETFKVIELTFLDLMTNQAADVEYSEHIEIEGSLVPQKIKMHVKSNQIVEVVSEYSKIELNKSLSFPFKISKKYEQMH